MFMCTSKFEVEEEDIALIQQYISNEEHQALNEGKDAQLLQDNLEPISDDEEDDVEILQDQPATKGLSKRAKRKRRRSSISEAEAEGQEPAISEDEADIPLPNTQQRVSSRNRTRSGREDDQFVHYQSYRREY